MSPYLVIVLCAALAAIGCGGADAPAPSLVAAPSPVAAPAPPPSAPPPRDVTPPVFSITMVDLDGVVQFIPFGVVLNETSGQRNPAYELLTRDLDAPVRAVTAGIVVEILENPSNQADLELHTRPSPNSAFLVVYDHVRDLTVQKGSAVAAGMVLGKVGRAGNYGRAELQINRAEPAPEIAVCPRLYGTAEFNAAHDAAVARAGGRWGSTVCTQETVVP